MTRAILLDVLCCCGWRGQLPTRAACPSCDLDHQQRMTKERLDKLRAIVRGEQPAMPPNMRKWFTRRGLAIPGDAPAPAPKRGGRAKFPQRELVATALGRHVIATAGEPIVVPPVDPVRRALARLLWHSVADKASCTCYADDVCPQCEAMTALGLGRWTGPDKRTMDALGALTADPRKWKGADR